MAVNKINLERDGLIVGDTQLVASGGGVTIGQNLAVIGNSYARNSEVINNLTVNGNVSLNSNLYVANNLGIGTASSTAKFEISAVGGSNPNFIMSGPGEQTFRFYNTSTTGSTRVSWKMASRLNTDWEWIWFTDSTSAGVNDLTLANLTGTAMYIDANRNVAISGNLTIGGNIDANRNVAISGNLTIGGNINSSRINPRFTNAAATSGTITINSDTFDQYQVVVNGTATFAAPSGTPVDAQKLTIRIKDSGSRQTISFTTGSANSFRAVGLILPTLSTAAVLYLGCVYNAHDSRWDAIALGSL